MAHVGGTSQCCATKRPLCAREPRTDGAHAKRRLHARREALPAILVPEIWALVAVGICDFSILVKIFGAVKFTLAVAYRALNGLKVQSYIDLYRQIYRKIRLVSGL